MKALFSFGLKHYLYIYLSSSARDIYKGIVVVPASSAPVECFFLLQVKLPQASEID